MLQPVVAQDIMVVSDMGDAWSPKMHPPNTAAPTRGMDTPILIAIGKAITDIMLIVPIEVPVAKDRSMQIMKEIAGRRAGVRSWVKIEDR